MEGDSSEAKLVFDKSIKDAEDLLEYCNSLGHPLPEKAEVFKRAGLVMAPVFVTGRRALDSDLHAAVQRRNAGEAV